MHAIQCGRQATLPVGLFDRLAEYRHEVFIERLGWELETRDGRELDQFDRPDTLYVVVQDERGRIAGCARLLPTHRPYLLGEVFPQLLNGLPAPDSCEVWELSRFCAVDLHSTSAPRGQFSSPVAIQLLHAAVTEAAAQGAKRLISVSPLGVERLLRAAGMSAHRAGPPMIVGGHPLFACWIDFPDQGRSGSGYRMAA